MRKILGTLVVSLALLIGLGLFLSQAQAQSECEHFVIDSPVQGELVSQSLADGSACVLLEPAFPGKLHVEGGWVYTDPLTINETEVVETKRVEGELAPQIVPFSRSLFAHEKLMFEASPTANGSSELGIFFSYVEPELKCEEISFSQTVTEVLTMSSLTETVTGACIKVNAEVPGELGVSGGWVFTDPLRLDGEVIETRRVSGELAAQVIPLTKTIETSREFTFLATPTQDKVSELGLWFNFQEEEKPDLEPACKPITITEPITGEVTVHSVVNSTGGACIEVRSQLTGALVLNHGWAFRAPVYLGGEVIETFTLPGDIAAQIHPLTRTMDTSETIVFQATPLADGNSEIGLDLSFREEEEPEEPDPAFAYQVYLPMVRVDPPDLVEERSFEGGLGVITAGWSGVVDGQRTCLRVNFISQEDATLLEGWTTDPYPEAWLNGEALELHTHETAGELFPQIAEKSLPRPKVLEVCLDSGSARELGLALSQQ